ncbi:unnamed protein product [Staurois parvus]|uniref:Uncharacterized protein n=1 Tax=Staurois parvus TaxID=386267 RepID=A0ABN9E7B6_9NEOB|nr:unnamed protein product [Staurois parvus]
MEHFLFPLTSGLFYSQWPKLVHFTDGLLIRFLGHYSKPILFAFMEPSSSLSCNATSCCFLTLTCTLPQIYTNL